MARIIDKDTRIIDIDFGPVQASQVRTGGSFTPTATTYTRNGVDQILRSVPAATSNGGSFIQYQQVDLSYMTQNNEVMQPVEVSVQRTSPVPLGYSNNGNNFDQIEEYVFIFSRPLNNTTIGSIANINGMFEDFRMLGLDRAEPKSQDGGGGSLISLGGRDAGYPDKYQTIYAEKRMYDTNLNNAATKGNGMLISANPLYNTLVGMPTLSSITTWGSLNAITGPNLHCYRVVIDRSQSFPALAGVFENEALAGDTTREWPPVSIAFLCKDPNYTEGELITTLANAMNSTPEGGSTA